MSTELSPWLTIGFTPFYEINIQNGILKCLDT